MITLIQVVSSLVWGLIFLNIGHVWMVYVSVSGSGSF
jgi:hypothetical protein